MFFTGDTRPPGQRHTRRDGTDLQHREGLARPGHPLCASVPSPPLDPTTDSGLATVELAMPQAQEPGGRDHARRPPPPSPTGSN